MYASAVGETATILPCLPVDSDAEVRLLEAALQGHSDSLTELARLLTPPIQVRVARALIRRGRSIKTFQNEVDDLTQEVFVRLFAQGARALRAWDPSRGLSLIGFVGLVAEREVSNVFRSNRRAPTKDNVELTEDLEHQPDWAIDLGDEQRLIYKDLLIKLCQRLQVWLTPRGRELFDVVYLEERPLQEVAQRFGMKPSAIYAWRNRVHKRARELLDELWSEEKHVTG